MENSKLRLKNPQATRPAAPTAQQGFALVSLIALVPMTVALVITLCASFYFFKRKSLAQAHCIQQAARMQNELKGTLDQLLRLNHRARSLRQQREIADSALKSALSSANPYAIAAAKAYWTAVWLQQLALRTEQQVLLRQADRQRQAGHRQLRDSLRALRVTQVDSRKYYWRSLAVEAHPPSSLTPDYKPLPLFEFWQQHRFRFQVDLTPPFLIGTHPGRLRQTSECSLTLKGKEKQWKIQILAVNAHSNWSWF